MSLLMGQFGEVKALLSVLNFRDGHFVDVGAGNGLYCSNTGFFERHLGWKGLCIEPNHRIYPKLVANRPDSICLDVAIWDEETELDFHIAVNSGSSRCVDHPRGCGVVETVRVKTMTLNHVLMQCSFPTLFELLSIDVEGNEDKVLEGFSLMRYLPRFVVIEDWDKGRNYDPYFKEWGYTPIRAWEVGRRGSNIIYCRMEHEARIVREEWRIDQLHHSKLSGVSPDSVHG